jgi:hypothetical protein
LEKQMSRVKPYKAKRRIADYAAIASACNQAVEQYRHSIQWAFDLRKPEWPICFPDIMSKKKTSLIGRVMQAELTAIIEDEPPWYKPRTDAMIENAQRGAVMQLAKYLSENGLVSEVRESVPGIGARLTFTCFACKITE